jgi:hypothetical protein
LKNSFLIGFCSQSELSHVNRDIPNFFLAVAFNVVVVVIMAVAVTVFNRILQRKRQLGP